VFLCIVIVSWQVYDELKAYRQLTFAGKSIEAKDYFFYSFIGSIVYKHGQMRYVSTFKKNLLSLLTDGIFMVVCARLLSILSCDDSLHLSNDPSVTCWIGFHSTKAFVSFVAFSYYVPISAMLAPVIVESDLYYRDIHFDKPYLMMNILMKTFLLIISIFLFHNLFATTLTSLIISFFLMLVTINWSRKKYQYSHPASFPEVNIAKIFNFFVSMWSSCVVVISVTKDIIVMDEVLLVFLGIVVGVVLGILEIF